MRLEVAADVRADDDDHQPSRSSIIEREPRERRRDAVALELLRHLGMDEGDPAVLDDVVEESGERAVKLAPRIGDAPLRR